MLSYATWEANHMDGASGQTSAGAGKQSLSFRPAFLPILLLLCAALSHPPAASEWQGERRVVDGVPHVFNPAEPMESPAAYELRELWRFSEESGGEALFGTLGGVTEDEDGVVYISDGQLLTVHVISPDGRYLRSIGREGEGPGELRSAYGVFLTHDHQVGVVDPAARAVVFLSKNGEPVGRWKATHEGFQAAGIGAAKPVPGGYVVSLNAARRSKTGVVAVDFIDLLDRDWQPAAEYARLEVPYPTKGETYVHDEALYTSQVMQGVSQDGRVFISRSFADYRIHVFNPDGSLQMIVEREFEPVRRSEEEIAEQTAYFEGLFSYKKDYRVIVSPVDLTVAKVRPRRDGSFWVSTSKSWRDLPVGVAETYDEFDRDGRFVRTVILKGDVSPEDDYLYSFGDNKMLVFRDGVSAEMAAVGASHDAAGSEAGEETPPVVICCEIARAE